MTQPELKGCPFCGGCPQLHTINMGDRWFVACLACVGRGTETYLREDAVAAWNTRPAPALTPKQEAADEMFDALERIQSVSRIAFSKAAAKGNTLAGALAKDVAEKATSALAKAGRP